jgi:uncharacterized protein YukE
MKSAFRLEELEARKLMPQQGWQGKLVLAYQNTD